jgi:hemolysin activation/secretion protein
MNQNIHKGNLSITNRNIHNDVYNNNNQLYNNELLRIGGQQIMRGFDEQSIFASWYQVLTTELRFLLGTNSYAYLFGDFSHVQNNSVENNNNTFRYGFGLGIALETKIGIFGLSYALGTSIDNPIIFRNGKVHFGYINLF